MTLLTLQVPGTDAAGARLLQVPGTEAKPASRSTASQPIYSRNQTTELQVPGT